MAEQLICNQQVDGSTPITSSSDARRLLPPKSFLYGSVPEWPKGTDCKSAGNAFGGPNPPAPTTRKALRNRAGLYLWWPPAAAGPPKVGRRSSRNAATGVSDCEVSSTADDFVCRPGRPKSSRRRVPTRRLLLRPDVCPHYGRERARRDSAFWQREYPPATTKPNANISEQKFSLQIAENVLYYICQTKSNTSYKVCVFLFR